jgi:hypothetical protein
MEAEDTECAELLLAAGATVKDTNALGYAISMHSVAKVRVLLERGDLTRRIRRSRARCCTPAIPRWCGC